MEPTTTEANGVTAMTFTKVAGAQTYEVTIDGVVVTVRKFGALWEALNDQHEVIAYGTSRHEVAKKAATR